MTKKVKLSLVLVSAIIILIGSVYGYRIYRKSQGVYIETVKGTTGGWGYKIYVKGKLVVNQPRIPALSGNKPFPCEEAAQKTAELVVQKVGKGEIPSVTINEMNEILKKNCK
jgi:hypothetical protein